jgi:hypothetical protein
VVLLILGTAAVTGTVAGVMDPAPDDRARDEAAAKAQYLEKLQAAPDPDYSDELTSMPVAPRGTSGGSSGGGSSFVYLPIQTYGGGGSAVASRTATQAAPGASQSAARAAPAQPSARGGFGASGAASGSGGGSGG